MKLSVVIVSYNVKHYLDQCLRSLFRASGKLEVEVFVVDNHSHDGTVAFIAHQFPEVHLIRGAHNVGFSRANNIALRQCQGEYVLLLNPDTIVGERTLEMSLKFLDAHVEDAGCLGVRMICANGEAARESRRGVPSPMVAFYKMSGLCKWFPNHPHFGHYYMGGLPWDKPCEVEVVSGAYCMMRRSVLENVGLLDEDFFMYGEDIDLSVRMLKAGYHNYYIPATILHYKGESTQKTNFRYVHVFYQAMLIFFRKHYAGISMLLALPIKLAIYAKACMALVMLAGSRLRKSLGFVVKKRQKVNYLFLGDEAMQEACERFVKDNGLLAAFFPIDTALQGEGHHASKVEEWLRNHPAEISYVVYDVEHFPYESIFRWMEAPSGFNLQLGTYHGLSRQIITQSEIFTLPRR